MAHTTRDKVKLLHRVRRIRGQLNAVETALRQEAECAVVLQTLVACHGALRGLIAEILERHVRNHLVHPGARRTSKRAKAAQDLVDVVRTYVR
jgi:DNA-binding FrmR family transcriptional regulator